MSCPESPGPAVPQADNKPERCEKHDRELTEGPDGFYCPICDSPFNAQVWDTVFKENRNCLLVVEGPPGTGKSYSCLRIAEDLDPQFYARKDITVDELKTRVLFDPGTFARVLNERNLYKGAVVIMEEGGVQADHRKWFTFNNMVFNYILQTFRYMNLIVLVNVPVMSFLDSDSQKMFQYHIETIKVHHLRGENQVKIKQQGYNTSVKKIYRRFLRFRINDRWVIINPWYLKKPSVRLAHEYEKLHREFKAGLIEKLSKEMELVEKQDKIKKQKVLANEPEIINAIMSNTERYVRVWGGRLVVVQATVETDFEIGRGISDRIKKRAEMLLRDRAAAGETIRTTSE